MRLKIEKIICDRCGREITEDPIRITPHYVARDSKSREVEEGRNELPYWRQRLMDKDFCKECANACVDIFLP